MLEYTLKNAEFAIRAKKKNLKTAQNAYFSVSLYAKNDN